MKYHALVAGAGVALMGCATPYAANTDHSWEPYWGSVTLPPHVATETPTPTIVPTEMPTEAPTPEPTPAQRTSRFAGWCDAWPTYFSSMDKGELAYSGFCTCLKWCTWSALLAHHVANGTTYQPTIPITTIGEYWRAVAREQVRRGLFPFQMPGQLKWLNENTRRVAALLRAQGPDAAGPFHSACMDGCEQSHRACMQTTEPAAQRRVAPRPRAHPKPNPVPRATPAPLPKGALSI